MRGLITLSLIFLCLGDSTHASMVEADKAWQRQDFKAAFPHLKREAIAGNILAQVKLAQLFQNGKAGSKNYIEAAKWYKKAASQNVAENKLIGFAQHNLAGLYWNGSGVSADRSQSVEWYHKAAINGYPTSQNVLAGLYLTGNEVEKNFVAALKWTVIAATNSHAKAQTNWQLLQKKATQVQIRQALGLAHKLFPSRGYLSQESISFQPPSGWKLAFTTPNRRLVEYIPENETVKNWTDMLTIITHPAPLDVRTLAINAISNWKKSCGKLRHKVDPELRNRKKLEQTYVILICDDPIRRQPTPDVLLLDKEIVWIKFQRGFLKTFEIQRAYHHAKGIAENRILAERFNKRLVEWNNFFKTVKLSSKKTNR
jgi:hypothetical protein